jgi:hypothetical protein
MKMVYVASVVGKSCNLVLILGTQWGLSSLLIVGDCLNSSRNCWIHFYTARSISAYVIRVTTFGASEMFTTDVGACFGLPSTVFWFMNVILQLYVH